jgi:hypothetical protein
MKVKRLIKASRVRRISALRYILAFFSIAFFAVLTPMVAVHATQQFSQSYATAGSLQLVQL